jgi:fluoride exporter
MSREPPRPARGAVHKHLRAPVLPVDPDAADTPSRHLAGHARSWDLLLIIAAGGAAGSVARWAVARALPTADGGFPWATFAVNVAGGLALGALMVLVVDLWRPHRFVRPFLGVGALGGFTTFSTYVLDVRDLVGDHPATALAYTAGTLAVGLAAVWAGIGVGRVVAFGVHRRRARRLARARR